MGMGRGSVDGVLGSGGEEGGVELGGGEGVVRVGETGWRGWRRGGMGGMGKWIEEEEEEEEACDAGEEFAKKGRILDTILGEDLRMIEEEEIRGTGFLRRSGEFRISVENTHEIVVEVAEKDPSDEDDTD